MANIINTGVSYALGQNLQGGVWESTSNQRSILGYWRTVQTGEIPQKKKISSWEKIYINPE